MANDGFQSRFGELKLDTTNRDVATNADEKMNHGRGKGEPAYFTSPRFYYPTDTTSQNERIDDIEHVLEDSPACPIAIPKTSNGTKLHRIESQELTDVQSGNGPHPSIDDYMRRRNTSISFSSKVKLETGEQQHVEKPPEKARHKVRGRSVFQAMADDKVRRNRAESESDRSHYGSGNSSPSYLYQNDSQEEQHQSRYGEARFPLLQKTVNDLARDAGGEPAKSLTSDSTISPGSEIHTPPDVDRNEYLVSPSSVPPRASSFEDFASWAASKSRQPATSDARSISFSSAPMTRNPSMRSVQQSSRRSTGASNKSPASVFLRGFSVHEEKAPSPDDEGQTIGVDPIYVIGKQIGYGGFSTIKEAVQVPTSTFSTERRKLAVKIVRRSIVGKNSSQNRAAQAEFDHEVDLWRRLRHSNILTLEAVYKSDFATFCFIPLNTGGTLFDLVRNNRSGLGEMLSKNLSSQLADALRYLHEDARVVHRDVKLENCLYEGNDLGTGFVRLCDFGMAEWLSSEDFSRNDVDRPPRKSMGPADSSSSAFVGGSLEYAAPETLQASNMQHDWEGELSNSNGIPCAIPVSAAVDVWAFGVCVFTMIVGSRPFQNTHFPERTWMDILGVKWDRERLQSKGGPDVYDLVDRGCLVEDVERRWDMREILSSKWLASEGHIGRNPNSFWGF